MTKQSINTIGQVRPDRAHRRLYAMLPKVPCIEGCTDCCTGGPPAVSEWERDVVPQDRREAGDTVALEVDTDARTIKMVDCPFKGASGCLIYEFRPLVCRAFGAVEDATMTPCPHGRKAKSPLPFERWARISAEYMKMNGDRLVAHRFTINGEEPNIHRGPDAQIDFLESPRTLIELLISSTCPGKK